MSSIRTITFGMGCFWSPDALFGRQPGVVRTRVGYTGGTALNPTYRRLGDHSETVELDYDPDRLTLEQLLSLFWNNHNPININDYKGRQYQSLVLYRDEAQRAVVATVLREREQQGKGRPATEIAPFHTFYPAEDRHQKYYLKRFPDAVNKLGQLYPTLEELRDATLPARLNGLAKGYGNLTDILNEIAEWPIGESERDAMVRLVKSIRW
ncbi:peptide-methionine (S)-S-oxide reductase MsrA [Paenibacillus hodogayensis]|uniref:Peptide methionine sulfoxide reductase MsrA n=1 Tax=Paenibacillus hodogayensis TaxID=279208 RepID=A0ABV5W5Z2_9BACL